MDCFIVWGQVFVSIVFFICVVVNTPNVNVYIPDGVCVFCVVFLVEWSSVWHIRDHHHGPLSPWPPLYDVWRWDENLHALNASINNPVLYLHLGFGCKNVSVDEYAHKLLLGIRGSSYGTLQKGPVSHLRCCIFENFFRRDLSGEKVFKNTTSKMWDRAFEYVIKRGLNRLYRHLSVNEIVHTTCTDSRLDRCQPDKVHL